MRFQTMATNGLRRPIIPLIVEAGAGARLMVDALVDTGADRTLLPVELAAKLGIDLSALPAASLGSALGSSAMFTPFTLILELRRAPEVLRWKAEVGFLSHAMTFCILGTKGFFEYFRIDYRWQQNYLDLEPCGALPL